MKRKKPIRALLIRAGRLGDTIWATSVIEPLREYYGKDLEIDFLVKKGMENLFTKDERIKKVFEIKHRGLAIFLTKSKREIILKSYKEPYDLAIDLETGTDFLSLIKKVKAHKKVLARDILNNEIENEYHPVDFARKVLASFIPNDISMKAFPTLEIPYRSISHEHLGIKNNFCVVHPGNSLLSRNKVALRSWPIHHWRKLLILLTESIPNIQVVLVGEYNETSYVNEIVYGLHGILNLCGRTSLIELMKIISKARFVVSTDTGPSHLAAALGSPLISIFGPTNPVLTGPFDNGKGMVKILRADMPCSPCINKPDFDSCQRSQCMENVTPDHVVTTISMLVTHSKGNLSNIQNQTHSFPG